MTRIYAGHTETKANAALDLLTQHIPTGRDTTRLGDHLTFQRRVNPLDFGCAGDGVTDDTANFLRAAAFACTNGLDMWAPSGSIFRLRSTVPITAPIKLHGRGVTILFDFPAATSASNGMLFSVLSDDVEFNSWKIAATGITAAIPGVNRYGIYCAGGYKNLAIRGVRFRDLMQSSPLIGGTKSWQTINVMHAMYMNAVEGLLLDRVRVDDISGAGLYAAYCTDVHVDRSHFKNFGWTGVWAHASNNRFAVTRNKFYGGTLARPSYWGGAIDIMGQTSDQSGGGLGDDNIEIHDNYFTGVYRYAQVVRLSSSHRVAVTGNTFENCDADLADTPGGATDAGAHNNLLQLTVRDISLVNNGPQYDVTVQGNTFIAKGAGYQKAIYVITRSGAQIPGNTSPGRQLLVYDNRFIAPSTSDFFQSLCVVHGFAAGYRGIHIRRNTGQVRPGAFPFYTPASITAAIALMTNAGTTIDDVVIRDNDIEFFNRNGDPTSNAQCAVSIQPYVTDADIDDNTFRDFTRAIIVDAANTGDMRIGDGNRYMQATGAAYPVSLRGVNVLPSISGSYLLAKTFDAVLTNETLTDVPEMAVPIGKNETMIVSFDLDVGSALEVSGLKLAVVTPAGAAQQITASVLPDTIADGNLLSKRTIVSGQALEFTPATQAGVRNAVVRVTARVQNGTTPGQVKLQAARTASLAVVENDGTDRYVTSGVASITAPHTAAMVSGGQTLKLRMRLKPEHWQPTLNGTLMAKWSTPTDDREWALFLLSTKTLEFDYSTDGVNPVVAVGLAALPFADGDIGSVGVDFTPDDGSGGFGNRVTKFWYKTEAGAWTQLGPTITVANTGPTSATIFTGDGPLEVGSFNGGVSLPVDADIYTGTVEIAGVVEASFNPQADTIDGDDTWPASTGEVWTVTARLVLRTGSIGHAKRSV